MDTKGESFIITSLGLLDRAVWFDYRDMSIPH